jgi:hypothetical protein
MKLVEEQRAFLLGGAKLELVLVARTFSLNHNKICKVCPTQSTKKFYIPRVHIFFLNESIRTGGKYKKRQGSLFLNCKLQTAVISDAIHYRYYRYYRKSDHISTGRYYETNNW